MSKPNQNTLHVKQLIAALSECDENDFVYFWNVATDETYCIEFVEKSISLDAVYLHSQKPNLEAASASDMSPVAVIKSSDYFAETILMREE